LLPIVDRQKPAIDADPVPFVYHFDIRIDMADTKSGSGRYSAAGGSGTSGLSPLVQGPANLECKDFQEYLRTRQTPESLEKLYNYPPICLAVFRELPEIARQFIIRILFVDQPVPQAVVTSWGAQRCAK